MPADLKMGSIASTARSTPSTYIDTLASTALFAQLTADSGVTSSLHVVAFSSWPLMPPISLLMWSSAVWNATRASGSEYAPPSSVAKATVTGASLGSNALGVALVVGVAAPVVGVA